MKIYIKLNKQESGQWNSIKSAVVGDGTLSDGEFAKVMLFRGINAFMDDLNQAMDEMSDAEKDEVLKEAGVAPEIEVEVPVAEEEDDENSTDSDK